MLVLVLILAFVGAATGMTALTNVVGTGLWLWWISSFFIECTGQFGDGQAY